ncbi:MAG: rRNA maturation RNase YbeY [Psychroserpens sp.]|nr:rRNA maturation RNase YbeY [Psychroserpens sp.]
MISYNYETAFDLPNETELSDWISVVVHSENCQLGEINYIFCDDQYLLEINQQYLDHDTLTDIISFDYSVGKKLQGDVFISVERVRENAHSFKVSFEEELSRVMIHGILHYCGYKDKFDSEKKIMRAKEDFYLKLLK